MKYLFLAALLLVLGVCLEASTTHDAKWHKGFYKVLLLKFEYAAIHGHLPGDNTLVVEWNGLPAAHLKPKNHDIHLAKLELRGHLGKNSLKFKHHGKHAIALDKVNLFIFHYCHNQVVNFLQNRGFELGHKIKEQKGSFHHKELKGGWFGNFEIAHGFHHNTAWGYYNHIVILTHNHNWIEKHIHIEQNLVDEWDKPHTSAVASGDPAAALVLSFKWSAQKGMRLSSSNFIVVWNGVKQREYYPHNHQVHQGKLALAAKEGKNTLHFIGKGVHGGKGGLFSDVKLVKVNNPSENFIINGHFAHAKELIKHGKHVFHGKYHGWHGHTIEVAWAHHWNTNWPHSAYVARLKGASNHDISQPIFFNEEYDIVWQ